ncbi:MAG: cytochrome d ubiquinol oxidase subunit II [Nitrospiraceae bacterium]
MSLEILLAGAVLVSLTFYVLLAGADFGAGVWSLCSSGPRAPDQRHLIAEAIAPIWEANHVWLILVVTILFTAFPKAFSLVSTALHIPLSLMLIGIVLRGSAFAFRTNDVAGHPAHDQSVRMWEGMFAWSSLLTPIMLGVTLGAVASGRLGIRGTFLETFVNPWLAPFPILVGLFALVLFAYLAAVYLILETDREDLREDFRKRAIGAGFAGAVLAIGVLVLSIAGAPAIWDGLAGNLWGRLAVCAAAFLGAAALYCLWIGRFHWARISAAGHVTLILWGWAAAQFPYLVEPHLTLYNAAAPVATLQLLLWSLILGGLLLFPSLIYLYRLFKRLG